MRTRAIRDLSQLSDPTFFTAVAEGLDLIVNNARRLYGSAKALGQGKQCHGSRVLQALSEEEASKFLILLDAVRCPRKPSDCFTAQLARFNDHLAKGLYARACWMRPATLGQLQEYLDSYRKEFYLDGPNDVDWIFRNDVMQRREEVLYVDYVATDEGHLWLDPARYNDEVFGLVCSETEPHSLQIAAALYEAGIATAEALATVAEIWRPVSMSHDMRWVDLRAINHRTLEIFVSRQLLQGDSEAIYQKIVDDWLFPLYNLDLRLIPVDINLLRERQRSWNPYW